MFEVWKLVRDRGRTIIKETANIEREKTTPRNLMSLNVNNNKLWRILRELAKDTTATNLPYLY